MEGNVLGIGVENEKLKETIKNNNQIKNCFLLEENPSILNKNKMRLLTKRKKVNIKTKNNVKYDKKIIF